MSLQNEMFDRVRTLDEEEKNYFIQEVCLIMDNQNYEDSKRVERISEILVKYFDIESKIYDVEKFVRGISMRTDGWYSFIKRKDNGQIVYENKCADEDSAMADSYEQFSK